MVDHRSHWKRRIVMSVKAKPEGYHSITAYLCISDTADAIEFYKKAFGAEEIMCLNMPSGDIAHAELRIGDSLLMLGSPCAEGPLVGSGPEKHAPMGLYLYVADVDKQYEKAVDAGAQVLSEVKDQFYGDRSCTLKDPWGNVWFLATHIEDVAPIEIERRAREIFQQS
jgi:PhnB protein